MEKTNAIEIRKLLSSDWLDWKRIRLLGLQEHPEEFGSSYEDESLMNEDFFKQRLQQHDILGAFISNELVGTIGFFVFSGSKMQHRGALFAVYVKPEMRGFGVAKSLIGAAINLAKTKVLQLHCTVTSHNAAAIHIYKKYGFEVYGQEPRSLKVGNQFYDEYLMVLKLDG